MDECSETEDLDQLLNIINSNYRPCSFGPVNGVAASYAAGDIIKYLGKICIPLSANKRIGIHSLKAEIEIQEMPRNDKCKVCSQI